MRKTLFVLVAFIAACSSEYSPETRAMLMRGCDAPLAECQCFIDGLQKQWSEEKALRIDKLKAVEMDSKDFAVIAELTKRCYGQ
jgi:hypothetical protein